MGKGFRPLTVVGLLLLASPLSARSERVTESSSDEAILRFVFADPPRSMAGGIYDWVADPDWHVPPHEPFRLLAAAAATLDASRALVAAQGVEIVSAKAEPEVYRFRVRRGQEDEQRLVWRRDFYQPIEPFDGDVWSSQAKQPVIVGRLTAPWDRQNVQRLVPHLWAQDFATLGARLLSERVDEDSAGIKVTRFTAMTDGLWGVGIWRWTLTGDPRDGSISRQVALQREVGPKCPDANAEKLELGVSVDPPVLVPTRSQEGQPTPTHSATVRVTLTNPTDQDVYLTFPNPCYLGYRVETMSGAAASHEGSDRGCVTMIGTLRLPPGGREEQQFPWTGRTWNGAHTPLPAGPYRIVGTLDKRYCGRGEQWRERPPIGSAPVTVEVRPVAN